MTPQEAQARLQNGLNQLRAGNLAGAEQDFRAVLKKDKRNFPALNLLAVVLMQQKRFSDAEPCLKAAYAINASTASTVYNYGLVLSELSRPKDALMLFDKAVALAPNDAEAWNSRGLALKALARFDDAVASYGKAIALRPGYADAHYNLGNVLKDLGRNADALASYDQAIALNPGHAGAYNNRSNALHDLKRTGEALASVERAIVLNPADAVAYYNRGCILRDTERYDEALASYDRSLALNPAGVDALHNRGIVLTLMSRYVDAAATFEKVTGLQPSRFDAYFGQANALQQLTRYAEAAVVYNKILTFDPQQVEALAQSLLCEMHLAEWSGYGKKSDTLVALSATQDLAVTPFPLLPIPTNLGTRRRSAEWFIRDEYPAAVEPLWKGNVYAHDRPRVAYFSTDFRAHPVAFLIAELFERHDRSRIDTVGFSISRKADDEMHHRIASAFGAFHEVASKSDAEIARLVRDLEIDILVDLNGLTAGYRPGIFARRPAPVQVNYLGFPGTMGAPYIDYIIGDHTLIPPEHFDGYTEKVVHLPHSFQVNDTKRGIAENLPSRTELGLPEDGFVFCCFNNSYKLTPDVFDMWMRLLTKTPGSVLWMRQDSAVAQANLIAEAKKRGVAAERLVFAPRTPTMADHLARQQRADLFLDTFYYNAHTTASDALWAGLPLVTCIGDTYASRVAASLLMALDMPELITHSHADYEALILQLVADPSRLAETRARLTRNIKTQPLFDIARFTRHIEDAYLQMWQRSRDGLPPAHIVVAP
jgi:predicted O-linked N-acetylglucosamine transferase (SPINDLY family)